MTKTTGERYERAAIGLHWATAVLVIVLWTSGQLADLVPKGPLRTDAWSCHFVLGFALAAVLIWRLVWRVTGRRRLPPADSGLLQILAEAAHYGLYLLLIATVALGLVNAFVRGVSLFDLASLPQIGDRELRKPITEWHELAANLLLGLALIHSAAALVHHYILKDGVLARMAPQRRPAPKALTDA
ncbi:cytochrome b [Methylocella sp.]|jgi:cytochrome b561|uniref:cytochrome b n=1 Tax=Methylocella sp. TaxID=1978226 RepID=UPI003C279A30